MRKVVLNLIIIFISFNLMPIFVSASSNADLDFTDSYENESGEGWFWNNDTKVLTLSDVKFDSGIILPADSSIKVDDNTENSIDTIDTVPITTNGKLTIYGKGLLLLKTVVSEKGEGLNTLNGVTDLSIENVNLITSGVNGLIAENITIKNSTLDIYGYSNGIYAKSSQKDKDLTVELINSTGKIAGQTLQGIEVFKESSGDTKLIIQDCNDLTISGNTTNKRLSGVFERSGVRIYVLDSKSDASVIIKNSKNINFYGTNTGIAIDCHSDDANVIGNSGRSSLVIENSVVLAETVTSTWAAFFVNNNGVGVDATAEITIRDSKVSAFAPNDVAMMTSTKNAASLVTVQNSILELRGVYAGIRAKSNTSTDADIFVIENSLVVVVGKTNSNYKTLDEMDKGTSVDGFDGVDENSVVISPKDCEINLKSDGNWEIPNGGTVFVNGKENNYLYGGVIYQTGNVLPYISSIDSVGFVDLNDALKNAKEGDNIVLFEVDADVKAILPFGVTLTSPISIDVKTNEFGYKVKEDKIDEKYVYTLIQAEKVKIIYHYNYNSDKIVERDIFEFTEYKLEDNIFSPPNGMELTNWIINGKKYVPGDIYYITEDLEVYAEWNIKENPNTHDNMYNSILELIISLVGMMVLFVFFKKMKE